MSGIHNSKRLHQEAVDKMNLKLSILKEWVTNGIPKIPKRPGPKSGTVSQRHELDYFPDGPQAFCAWTSEKNCQRTLERYPQLAHIKALSRGTFGQPDNEVLRDDILEVIEKLKLKAAARATTSDAVTQLALLTADRDRWKTIAEVQENDVRELRLVASTAQTETRLERRARMNNDRALNERIAELSEQVAELTATVKNVTGFRSRGTKNERR